MRTDFRLLDRFALYIRASEAHEFGIPAGAGEQPFVGAPLDHPAGIEEENLVRESNRVGFVGNDDAGDTGQQRGEIRPNPLSSFTTSRLTRVMTASTRQPRKARSARHSIVTPISLHRTGHGTLGEASPARSRLSRRPCTTVTGSASSD